MYQKYNTEGLVLGSRERGEADRVYSLYTRDFGLVTARASAVRRESSRMRYALQNYSASSISLVKGTRGWRVAGAAADKTPIGKNVKGIAAFARIAALVTRFVPGEESHEYIFASLSASHDLLMQEACDAEGIEILSVARVLYALGYLSIEGLDTELFTHTDFTPQLLIEASALKDDLLTRINYALTETHL